MSEGLFNGAVGVAVVSDAKTGELLALVSLPGYDNNVFGDDSREDELSALLKDPEQPFFHRAVAGNYPPGSTFKLVTGLGGLQEGVSSRNTIIESKGILWVPHDYYPGHRQPFPDHSVLGKLNYPQAIANSSNIYFFYLGGGFEPEGFVGLGNERLARYARMIGFGTPTGIDLPGETAGTVPDEAWKQQKVGERWVKGDTYNMSIGQGYVESSPLQVHGMASMIANNGKLLRPRVVRQIVDSDGKVEKTAQPEVIRTVDVDQRHIQNTIEGMELSFTGGLLRDYRIPGLRVAGKTGTAEYGQATNPQGELPTHGWFTGFAPIEDPKVVVTVFVERGSSSRDAAPIAAADHSSHLRVPGRSAEASASGCACTCSGRHTAAGSATGRRADRPRWPVSAGQPAAADACNWPRTAARRWPRGFRAGRSADWADRTNWSRAGRANDIRSRSTAGRRADSRSACPSGASTNGASTNGGTAQRAASGSTTRRTAAC